jgi:iron-sulfur cluster repair protein YtfE (RIC family)
MTQTLPQIGHQHHERLLEQLDRMPALADGFLTATPDELRRDVDGLRTFITGRLLPHVEATETTLYPELERLYQNRHSMAPMRAEHRKIRQLAEDFMTLAGKVDLTPATLGMTLALRRVIFQLYALLKIHLAEEEIYLRIVDHGVAADAAEVLAAALDHPGFRAD